MSNQTSTNHQPTIGYLSAALRVSTFPEAEAAGPRSHILGTMKGFRANGWRVLPFIIGDRMPRKSLSKGGQKVIGGSKWRILLADLVRVAFGILNAKRAVNELGNKVDIVYERVALLQSFGNHFQRRGIPWILESNGLLHYEAKQERNTLMLYRLARYLELKAYRQCDLLVCVSEALKATIMDRTNIPAEKIVVIPNGVDLDHFDPKQVTPKRFFTGLTVGYVGGVIPRQGIELLIEAIGALKAEGIIINATIVGNGISCPTCEALAETLHITDQIHFTGLASRDEIPSLIAGFDIGYSGQLVQRIGTMYHSPLKIYEYMAAAKPVLAAAFHDAHNTICEKESGFLFESGNHDDLTRALRFVYAYQDNLANMGQAARTEAAQKHSWESRVAYLLKHIANSKLSKGGYTAPLLADQTSQSAGAGN